MIRKTGKGYVLRSESGDKILGHHPSKASAVRQEIAIKLAKARASGKRIPKA